MQRPQAPTANLMAWFDRPKQHCFMNQEQPDSYDLVTYRTIIFSLIDQHGSQSVLIMYFKWTTKL